MPSTLTLTADSSDKLRGLELLRTAGLPTPTTVFLRTPPREFPELGCDSVIFRPSLAQSFTAEAVQAASGLVDSLIVRRSEWWVHIQTVQEMVRTWPTIVQPLVHQVSGAIAHYWPREAVLRLAVAETTTRVAQGEDAALTGRLFIAEGQFTTESQEIADEQFQLIDAVSSFAGNLAGLPPMRSWEIEMCLSPHDGLFFLQAQPSTAMYKESWT